MGKYIIINIMHYITHTTHLHLVPVKDYNVMYWHDYDVKSNLMYTYCRFYQYSLSSRDGVLVI